MPPHAEAPSTQAPPDPGRRLASAAALALGAVAMGASPIFVRLADVGPFASAFWRMALALPFLWAWLRLERQRLPAAAVRIDLARDGWIIAAIGILFAGDLFFWHLAILNTSVANATLLATMTPIIVTLGAWLVLKEEITPRILGGVVLGVAGAVLLVGASARFAPGQVVGDMYGLITALFFGCYFLAVSAARRRLSTATIMYYPALVTTALLLVIALAFEDRLLPQSWAGVAILAGLALVSQVGGQGLTAYALGYLPAIFSSLVIFFEAIAAAIFAWMLLAEPVSAWQLGGGALLLAGLYAARPTHKRTEGER